MHILNCNLTAYFLPWANNTTFMCAILMRNTTSDFFFQTRNQIYMAFSFLLNQISDQQKEEEIKWRKLWRHILYNIYKKIVYIYTEPNNKYYYIVNCTQCCAIGYRYGNLYIGIRQWSPFWKEDGKKTSKYWNMCELYWNFTLNWQQFVWGN